MGSAAARRAAKARPARPLNPRARGDAAAVAAANRAAALAANSHEARFARDKALFIGGSFDDEAAVPGRDGSPEAPGKRSALSPAARRARRREGAARFGRKAMSVFMAVVLAIGLMPLPAFGDDGQVKGVSFNGNLIAGSVSTTTTVDADGNVTTETTQTKVDDEGNVVSETTTESDSDGEPDDGGLDSDANLRGQYFLGQATALKSDGTIQDLAGAGDIGKVSDGSDSRLSVAAGAQALEDREDEAEQAKVDEAQAAFGAEDAGIDVSGVEGDFSSQRIVVALRDGASLQERDLNNVVSRADSMYILAYKDADAAKRAYVRYTNYEGAEFAAPDAAVEAADGEGGDDPDPVEVPKTESGEVDYSKVAKDGPGAEGAEEAQTDAPELDASTYDADKKEAEERSERRNEDEKDTPDGQKTAVVVVIDTLVAQDAPVAARLSLVAESQEAVSDDDPDHDAKLEAQHARHGSRMVDAVVGQLEEAGAQVVGADGNRLAGSEDASARKVQIVSIEALDASDYGSAGTVLAAAQLAAAYRPDVVNMSFAGHATEGNRAVSEAVKLLAEGADGEAGTADDADVVAAAGNQGRDARFFVPASSEGAFAVGALDASKVAALRGQAAHDLFGDGDLSLDDAQLAELDAAVAGRIAADPQAYKRSASNYGETVDAWLVATSTSEAAAKAAGYAAARGDAWRVSIAASPIAIGDTGAFATAGSGTEAEGSQEPSGAGDVQAGPEAPEPEGPDGAGAEGEGGEPGQGGGLVAGLLEAVLARGDAEGVRAQEEYTTATWGVQPTTTEYYSWSDTAKALDFGYNNLFSSQTTSQGYSVNLPAAVYTVQTWGAQGGKGESTDSSSDGGKGGYSVGDLRLASAEDVYVHVGGQGERKGPASNGGYNGGGGTLGGGNSYRAGTGGGGTDMRIGGESEYYRFIVAGGGGGGGGTGSRPGGAGGGANGVKGATTSASTQTGVSNSGGGGGTQTAGGSAGGFARISSGSSQHAAQYGTAGGFYSGGTGATLTVSGYGGGAGGGGGWFGGGGGASTWHYTISGGGGGGSGFVLNSGYGNNVASYQHASDSDYALTNSSTAAGNTTFESTSGGTETGHAGNGYARIKLKNYIVVYHDWDGSVAGTSDFGAAAGADGLYTTTGNLTAASTLGLDDDNPAGGTFVGWTADKKAWDDTSGLMMADDGLKAGPSASPGKYSAAKSVDLYPCSGDYSVVYKHGKHGSGSEAGETERASSTDAYMVLSPDDCSIVPESGWAFTGWKAKMATSGSLVQPDEEYVAGTDLTKWLDDSSTAGNAVAVGSVENSTVTLVAQVPGGAELARDLGAGAWPPWCAGVRRGVRRRGRRAAEGYSAGFLRRTRSGKWAGVLKYRDATGQRRQVTKTLSADRAEAEALLGPWAEAMRASGPPRGAAGPAAAAGAPGPTVEEAVRSCLAADLGAGRIERSTHDMQLAACERDLFGELGRVPVASLTPAAAQGWADALCARVAPGTARVAWQALSKALARSERAGLIAASPLARCDPPRAARPARAFLPPPSVALLGEAVRSEWGGSHPYALATALALMAGLRAGECCALRWRDVWEGFSGLDVRAGVGRSAAGCYLKGPKCPSSRRSMPVVPALSGELAARASAQGAPPGQAPPGAWFCCGEEGRFTDPRTLSRAFSRLCERAGVLDSAGERAHFHQLRHTFATNAVRAGVDVRTLADLLGHSRADVTLNVYAGSDDGAKAAAVARLAALG